MPPESAPDATQGVSRSDLGAATLKDASDPTVAMPRAGGGGAAGLSPPNAITLGDDWAGQLTHKVEEVVALVRDKTVTPVAKAVKYLIFGVLALFVGAAAAVLFAVFAIRVLDSEVPVFRTRVWASYLVVAGIFWLAGMLLSRRRHSRS
jgi:hypothetical protein